MTKEKNQTDLEIKTLAQLWQINANNIIRFYSYAFDGEL